MTEAVPFMNDLPAQAAARLRDILHSSVVRRGDVLVDQGDPAPDELLLQSGFAVAQIIDQEGRHTCTGLYAGPQIITPQIARAMNGVSMVTIEMLSDGVVARINADALQALMVADADVRDWGNAALRADLIARVAREWTLAALPAIERLAWLRQTYPQAEAQFPHHLIAGFLGMTPVTFSRVRRANS